MNDDGPLPTFRSTPWTTARVLRPALFEKRPAARRRMDRAKGVAGGLIAMAGLLLGDRRLLARGLSAVLFEFGKLRKPEGG